MYVIRSVRGGLHTISSANAEQIHSSNKHVTSTAQFGIMTPDRQMLQLTYRNDEFARQDIKERQQLALVRASQLDGMTPGSLHYKAILALSNYAYKKHFIPSFNRMGGYRKSPYTANGDNMIGHNVTHLESHHVSFVPMGGRCHNPRSIGYSTQCVHELLVDERFITTKWDSRWLCNEKYDALFRVSRAPTQLNKSPVQLVATLPATTTTVVLESASVSN